MSQTITSHTPDEVVIPVRVEVDLSETRGSAYWDVKDVIDERDGSPLGDIGIYEFYAYSDVPGLIMNAVLRTLRDEAQEFKPNLFYSVQIEIYDGGSLLGHASRHFWGRDALRSDFAKDDFETDE